MKKVFIISSVLLVSLPLYSEDFIKENIKEKSVNAYAADEIVISAQGYAKPLTSTTGGVGILTSESIMKLGPVSVSDAMQGITGVSKISDSSWGSEISIRGASRDKVVMLIDGSRMNTATDIGAQFGTLNPMSVERIEILKGPVSSLYGSGSIGGVVNIFTRTGKFSETPGFESGFSVAGESNAAGADTYGFTSWNSPGWYLFGSGSYRSHNDYSDGDGKKTAYSGFNDAEGTVNFGFKPALRHTVEIRSQFYQGWDIGIPGARDSVPESASGAEYTEIRRGLLSIDYKIIPETDIWLESKVHVYWQYLKREVKIENSNIKIEPKSLHNTSGIQWTNITAWENNCLIFGADTWIRTISTGRKKTNMTTGAIVTEDTPIPDAYYLSAGIFAEDDIKFGDLGLNFGARGDSVSVSNSKTYKTDYPASSVVIWDEKESHEYSWNGHAGISYVITGGLTTTALAASGYRAASLEERYKYIALGTTEHWGNPDLEPERSYFFEYGLHLKTSNIKANASVYLNMLHNLITEVKISSTEYRLENINSAQLQGAEYDIKIAPDRRFEIYNNLSYVRGTDTKKNMNLPSIAPLRIVSGIKINGGYGLSSFLDVTYTAAQNRVPDGSPKSESWYRVDAGIVWKLERDGADHKVAVTCANLLDKTYYDYLTMSKNGYVFNEPGRSVKCGYSVLF